MSGGINTGLGVLSGDIAQGQDRVLASPYEDLSSPVIASARGKQLEPEEAGNPGLERFIGDYRHGPKTPEPGAGCTGAAEEPV